MRCERSGHVNARGPVTGPTGPAVTVDTTTASPARMYDYYLGGYLL
jgi:hypothetical protein